MKILLKVSFGLLLLAIVALVGVRSWLGTAPKGIEPVEQALATSDLALIGLVDHHKIKIILGTLQGQEDPMPIPVPGIDRNLIDKLFQGPANLAEDLQQTLVSIHFDAEQGINVSMFLLGDIRQAPVQSALNEYFEITETEQGHLSLLSRPKSDIQSRLGNQDGFICPADDSEKRPDAMPRSPVYAKFLPQGLLIASNENYIDAFSRRLAGGEPALVDLTDWNSYKQGKLISFMAADPHQSAAAAKGISGLMLKGVSDQNAEITRVAGSVAVDLLNFNLGLDLTTHANSRWAEEKAAAGNRKLAEYVGRAGEFSKSLAQLVNNASLESRDDALIARLDLPFDFVSKVGDVITEVVAGMITFGGSGDEQETVEEELMKDPWDYSEQIKLATMTDLPQEDGLFRPNYQKGPFAFSVENAELDQGVLALTVNGKAQFQEIEAKGFAKGFEVEFSVVSLKDKNGNELLRDERCLTLEPSYTKKNQQPDRGSVFQNQYQFRKKVRLVESARLQDIDRIVLRTDIFVDTDIKVFEVRAKPGEVIEFQGARLFISKVDGHTVNYQLSGNKEAMLELRALNQDRQPLRGSGGFGFGDLKSDKFKGEVKYIRAFFAQSKRELKKDFDFKFERLIKREDINTVALHAWVAKPAPRDFLRNAPPIGGAVPGSERGDRDWSPVEAEHRRGTVSAGPIRLELYHNHEEKWSYEPLLRVFYPFTDELVSNLNGIRVTMKDKNESPYVVHEEFSSPWSSLDGEIWLSPRYSLKGRKYEAEVIELEGLGLESGEKLDSLEGEIVFRLPGQIVETPFDMPAVGESVQFPGGAVTLTKVSFSGIARISLSVSGDYQNVLSIVALNDKNEGIRHAQIYRREDSLGIDFDNRADIRKFVLYSAAAVNEVGYAFKFEPEY